MAALASTTVSSFTTTTPAFAAVVNSVVQSGWVWVEPVDRRLCLRERRWEHSANRPGASEQVAGARDNGAGEGQPGHRCNGVRLRRVDFDKEGATFLEPGRSLPDQPAYHA